MENPWPKVISREIIQVSEWLPVVVREVQFSRDCKPEKYYAVEQPSYVAALAITPEGRVPLVRQYRPAVERPSLELPAGMLDKGEDPAAAMARELLEETGYPSISIELLGTASTCANRISNSMYSYLIRTGPRVANFVGEPGVSVELATLDVLWAYIRSGELSEQTHLGVLMLAVAKGFLYL